jgi:hypothetical protein
MTEQAAIKAETGLDPWHRRRGQEATKGTWKGQNQASQTDQADQGGAKQTGSPGASREGRRQGPAGDGNVVAGNASTLAPLAGTLGSDNPWGH